ncbi:unnamed protein product [Leptidea sinapis]|uniref:CRAL/TRIO N-terminal domain-containing protein n=1 Tax=Leptidea sinapis TaxID=189913 RepID=A0A5E4QS27_9NEOP|nr:unnamed protein product [Leptidea sinapis]
MESFAAKEFPIEEEYKKNHGVTPEDVMVLRKWLQTQPHLPERAMLMIIDLWQYEEGTWPALELVFNFANYTFGHITKIDLRNIQLITFYLQSELLKCLHIYSDGIAALHNHIPAQHFPKDVGGEYKTLNECKDVILKKLRGNAAFFAAESKKRVSEELRQNEQRWDRAYEHLVYGSFKKLDID